MENQIKKSETQLDLKSVENLLSAGAAAGMALSIFAGKKGNEYAIMGAGLALLLGGILVASE